MVETFVGGKSRILLVALIVFFCRDGFELRSEPEHCCEVSEHLGFEHPREAPWVLCEDGSIE